jgi:hypothetical protein
MKTILTNKFELQGNSHYRLLRLAVFARFIPIGNLRGGPGVRCLIVLTLLHYCGYPVYFVHARYGHRLGFLKRLLYRLRKQ